MKTHKRNIYIATVNAKMLQHQRKTIVIVMIFTREMQQQHHQYIMIKSHFIMGSKHHIKTTTKLHRLQFAIHTLAVYL